MMSHRLSALSGRSDLEIIDIDGQKTAFTTSSRDMILGFGWMFYILGNISNIIFYFIHPSQVEMGRKIMKRERWFVYFLGTKYDVYKWEAVPGLKQDNSFNLNETNQPLLENGHHHDETKIF